ncbi:MULTISPECIES: hypothetical protein [Clostridium]|jgi:hypothetical protein|uniref:hypothetical protein n=1 Tax=Clostridium TaxID=1485 RepID=UPI00243220AE|nr:hypothetical protein [Clostridium tyrobutyricum]
MIKNIKHGSNTYGSMFMSKKTNTINSRITNLRYIETRRKNNRQLPSGNRLGNPVEEKL